jgi:hypothetical protein
MEWTSSIFSSTSTLDFDSTSTYNYNYNSFAFDFELRLDSNGQRLNPFVAAYRNDPVFQEVGLRSKKDIF